MLVDDMYQVDLLCDADNRWFSTMPYITVEDAQIIAELYLEKGGDTYV